MLCSPSHSDLHAEQSAAAESLSDWPNMLQCMQFSRRSAIRRLHLWILCHGFLHHSFLSCCMNTCPYFCRLHGSVANTMQIQCVHSLHHHQHFHIRKRQCFCDERAAASVTSEPGIGSALHALLLKGVSSKSCQCREETAAANDVSVMN